MTPLLARTPGAEKQFERLYKRYAGDVYRYAMAVMRNAQDAEDVTQTTFMNAYRAMQAGERPDTPKNWLIAIAHNVCRQRFRQAQRRPQESPLFEDAAEVAVPEKEEGYSAEDIHRALGQLAFNQRAALVMRELEGRTYAEIAEMMGLSVSAVETVIFRARRALREQLEGTLTCAEAERFLSKQLDGELDRRERGGLRAHLRACEECSALARKQRASRGALKMLLGGIPLPGSLLGLGSGATVGVAAKAAAIVAAGAVVGTGGYEAAKKVQHQPSRVAAAAAPAVGPSATHAVGTTRAAETPAGTRAVGLGHASVKTHTTAPNSHARVFHTSTHALPVRPVTPARQSPTVRGEHPAKPSHPSTPATPAAKPAATAHTNPVHKPAVHPKPVTPVKKKKPAAKAHSNPPPARTTSTETTTTSPAQGRGAGLSR
jgi:RNA polymerase sigma-70 factor (ECF subfamily)